MWINFREKEANLRGGKRFFLREKRKRKGSKGKGSSAFSFIKDIDYYGVSREKEKDRKSKKKNTRKIVHSIVGKKSPRFAKRHFTHSLF